MGRRLNVSTPTVINTELVPLDESFYIDVDGQMEQWYYDNTEQYAPNRKVTPLLLVPVISAFDKDTSTSYTPTFNTTQWFANEWNEAQGKYVETEITNQVDSGSADYVIQGNNLLVKKNVSYSHAVSIRCVATYIDPRDSGVTYAVESSVNLTTNRTADVVFPEVDIISPSGRAYNPLVDDENSQYDFKGVTTNNPVQPLNTDVRRYHVDVDGTEEILNSGEAVAPIMDIRYGNNPTMADQEFMYRQTADGELVGESIDKAYIERIKGNTVAWNQLYSKDKITTYQCTYEFDGENIIMTNNNVDGEHSSNISGNIISGHKYYLKFKIENLDDFQKTLIIGFAPSYGGYFSPFPTLNENETRTFKYLVTASDDFNGCIGVREQSANGRLKWIGQSIDLTLIYGEGNEPTTPEQFEADYERWFGKPLTYEEYDEGSLRPVLMRAIQTKGANNSWTKIQTMPITTLTGKLNGAGNSVTIFPDGLKKCGEVYDSEQQKYIPICDEIFVEDGIVKAIKRVGSVDLGDLMWDSSSFGTEHQIFYSLVADAAHSRAGFKSHTLQAKYNQSFGAISASDLPDRQLSTNTNQNYVYVRDDSYPSVDTFKAANKGVMLYYELETPQTYVLDPITDFVWYGIKDGQEVLADTLPWYVSGQGTDNLVVDAMYGENINVVLRCKMMDGETLSPSKAYATLSWRLPDIETFVQSDNGGAVRSSTKDMTFDTIVNVNGDVLSDALKQKHLAFNWKIRKNNVSTETDKGWGQRITIDASDLYNVKGSGSTLASTLVGNEVYLKGAYEEVTDNGEIVTDNGEVVYDRPITE